MSCSFQQNLTWNTFKYNREKGKKKEKRDTYNVWIEGFHVDVASRTAGKGPDFGFVLKGSSNLWEKKIKMKPGRRFLSKKLCLFSQVQPAILSPLSFLRMNITVLKTKKQSTPTFFVMFMVLF